MPILQRETDIYPENLFQMEDLGFESDRQWWALYSLARREKELMRRLVAKEIPFYAPVIEKRRRTNNGRHLCSYIPLFPGYVFLYGDNSQRYESLQTNCVSSCFRVVDGSRLTADLRQFYHLIQAGEPLTPEARLEAGAPVRVKRGPLAGIEGVVVRREGRERLLVAIDFLQKGASLQLNDLEVEPV